MSSPECISVCKGGVKLSGARISRILYDLNVRGRVGECRGDERWDLQVYSEVTTSR